MSPDLAAALFEGRPIALRTTELTPQDAQRAEHLCELRRYIAARRGYESHPGKERPGALQHKAHFLGALGELKAGADLQHLVHLTSPLLDTRPERFDREDAQLLVEGCRLPVDIKCTARDDSLFLVNEHTAQKDEAQALAAYLVLWTPKTLERPTQGEWHLVPWDYFAAHRRLHEKPDAHGHTSRYYSCRFRD